MSSGIYLITNIITNKIYVGSSLNIEQRWNDHRKLLRKNKHRNRHLQNAWNKDGECSFVFEIIEHCTKDVLTEREQYWIDHTKCIDDAIGYNINPSADTSRGRKYTPVQLEMRSKLSQKVWPGFIQPDGVEITITNLTAFAKNNNLNPANMMKLAYANTRLKTYKGWTHINIRGKNT